ncbi:MAG TPA: CPBP family intramembrane glutamic endopeptidase [Anaerolineales bacterium]|nr:CPBP family intramembrane glutamic endopeptidase [Anaerolineales bacterium]
MAAETGDRRLPTGWRLVIHGLITLGLLLVLSVVASVAFVVLGAFVPIGWGVMIAVSSVVSAVVFVGGSYLARRFLDRRSFVSLGFAIDRHTLPDLLVGFLIPLPMMSAVFLIESSMGWILWEGWAWQEATAASVILGLAGGLVLFIGVGIAEETMSRGYQLQNLAEGIGLPKALLVSSGLFSVLHVLNPGFNLRAAVGLLLAGLFLASGWVWTRRLWLSIGLHIGWNFFEGTIFGYAVSGLGLFRLMLHSDGGPEWATGGVFGPEAGLMLLPALAVGTPLVWLYARNRLRQANP